MIKDVIADVLLKDPTANNLIQSASLSPIKVNVYRYKQSLDDQALLFWRPCSIKRLGEWPFIYFLKLEKDKVIANTDLGAAIQKIDTTKVNICINALDMANKSFYGFV